MDTLRGKEVYQFTHVGIGGEDYHASGLFADREKCRLAMIVFQSENSCLNEYWTIDTLTIN